jgi:Uma2 family endonuclease
MASVLEKPDLHLPTDGRKWEWVDGEAKLVPTGFEHDAIAGLVYRLLFDTATLHGVLTISQAGFRMEGGNVRSPDVGFTRFTRLPRTPRLPGGYLEFAPDLCVEVISQSETQAERTQKLSDYFHSGALLVWELFPGTKTIHVHEPGAASARILTETDTLDAGMLIPEFSCRVADCFAIPGWPQRV